MKINYEHTSLLHNTSAAREILPFVFNLFHPLSIIDVGCGTGSWLNVSKELGVVKVLGVDGIMVDKSMLVITKEEFIKHDLTQALNLSETYDMAICLEVVEHLPYEAADTIVETLTNHSDVILFSAAIPGQGGQFHINEQWPEYWQKKFIDKGYLAFDILKDEFWDHKEIEWWYKQNMLVFAKTAKSALLNYSPVEKVYGKVHPELFELKLDEIKNLKQTIKANIWEPKFRSALKLLIKSMLNAFK